jgi:hypothetical protein
VHGNIGRSNRRTTSDVVKATPSLITYLENVSTAYGEPYATRFVREITGTTLRDAEVDAIELPSNMAKRKIYRDFCFDRGYLPKADAKSSYGAVRNYQLRPYEDLLWPEGSEPLPICSWQGFLGVWKDHFPKLTIRNPCEDTCGECTKIRNQMYQLDRMQQRRAHAACAADSGNDDDDAEIASIDRLDSGDEMMQDKMAAEYELISQQEFPAEVLILQASLHVAKAKRQREYASQRIAESKETANNEWEDRR